MLSFCSTAEAAAAKLCGFTVAINGVGDDDDDITDEAELDGGDGDVFWLLLIVISIWATARAAAAWDCESKLIFESRFEWSRRLST